MTEFVDQLIALFNRRSMDLPDGLFSRHTQFLLNGVPFENMLGRAPSDPLILMLARGPAGYRFTAKAVQHAIPDAQVQRGELTAREVNGVTHVRGECWISGHFRGSGEPAEVLIAFEIVTQGHTVERVGVTVDETALDKLRAARVSP